MLCYLAQFFHQTFADKAYIMGMGSSGGVYIRTARCTASDILVAAQKTGRSRPHKSQEECAPRGVSKVSPILRLSNPFLALVLHNSARLGKSS